MLGFLAQTLRFTLFFSLLLPCPFFFFSLQMQYVYNTIFTPSPKSGQQSCSRTNPKRPLDRSAGDSLSDNRYQLVDEILAATSYYSVLGISRKTSPEDVRRAYIKVAFCAHFFVISCCIRRFVIFFLTQPSPNL